MGMLTVRHKGSLRKIEKFLQRADSDYFFRNLDKYGQMGVNALMAATPKRSGRTASSWTYEIKKSKGQYAIYWVNTNVNKGANIAVLIQYGHGTGNGAYVQGVDYINPALQSTFLSIADDIWKEVSSS